VSSTFLNLVVVPAGYSLVFGLKIGKEHVAPESVLGRLATAMTRRLVKPVQKES